MSHVIRAAEMNVSGESVGVATPTLGAGESIICRVRSAPRWSGRPHSHDREEIIVALRGEGTVTLDGEKITFSEGDAIVITAGSLHQLEAGPDGMECITVEPVGIRFFDPEGRERPTPDLML